MKRLAPTWDFPFRIGNGCTMVSPSVWNVRWQRDLSYWQKLQRAGAPVYATTRTQRLKRAQEFIKDWQ